ncbi:hypothetical protein F7725_028851 [Dissostichus mawsoni]|uniref:Uncharacterized protein n=1 Tax=Dissostichus mawsoni TaxID=36200 RepID=A0A7J5XHI9_DISMA|nr:hypothetical protein F7725_028851 [Dissostichus mawsoni]
MPLNTPRRARESRHVIGQCRLPYVIQDPDYKMCGTRSHCFRIQLLWRTRESDNMLQQANPMDRPAVERSQTTDNRRTHGLYPSLPGINRYDVCVAVRSTGEKPHSTAVHSREPAERQSVKNFGCQQ